MSPNARGALIMVAAMASFGISDICIKATGGSLPVIQIMVLRAVLTTIGIFFLARALGGLRFDQSRRDWIIIGIRSTCEFLAAIFFFAALFRMKFANVAAVLQVLPLAVTLGAVLFYGEKVGWRRAMAILAGFVGVLIIIRPGPEGFDTGALYVLVTVFVVAIRDLSVRKLSPSVPSLTVTFAASAAVLIFSAITSVGIDWAPVDPRTGILIAASSIFVTGGYLFSVMAMRVGEISFVAPFRYSSLLIALVLGWLLFGEWPTPVTLMGAGVVVASGLFMFARQRVREQDA
ncbi:DMT family transporter [Chachezhania sediminis]|uniref:DMT family transporter n=1 Tax=Chachezhania sediminis TaxID=2599291 RepID=UPI00131B6BBE|nr:DMT family transporter [Chachezhania sediminis]